MIGSEFRNDGVAFKKWMPLPGEALRRFEQEELKQTRYRPTVVIGLGGSGLAVVRQLKRLIRSYFGEKEREIFQFLVFDTTAEEVPEGEEPLDAGEFVHLGAFDAAGLIYHLNENPYIKDWWPGGVENPYRVEFSGGGAHRVRAVGRLVFFHYINTIVNQLQSKIDRAIGVNAQHGIGARSLKFYIVCSLAGGTGSGMVLDMAYLARKLGLDTQFSPYVTGVLITDDPFLPKVETAKTKAEFSANVYGALREISHFTATRVFHENYDDHHATDNLRSFRPFNVAYLLGLHNRDQALESFEALANMVATEMMMEIASPLGKKANDQLDNARGPEREIAGQPTPFSSFALSSLVYPLKGVASWSALRALEAFSSEVLLRPLQSASEVEPDVAAFMQKVRVEEAQDDQLLHRLNLDEKGQSMVAPALSHAQVENLAEHQLQAMMQHMEETALAEAAAIREQIGANVRLIQKTFVEALNEEAEAVLRDARRGPRYLTWFLSALQRKLGEQRDTDMMGEQAMYSDQAQTQQAAWEAASAELAKALRLPGWWPLRSGRIARARSRRLTAFNAYVSATIEREKRTQAVQCQNDFVEDTAALSRRASDLVSDWEKLAQTAEAQAQGEVTQEQATSTDFSLMHSIISLPELRRTYKRHLPEMTDPERRESLASRFWQFFGARVPAWTLAGEGPVLQGEANPAVQAFYFLVDWYIGAIDGKSLLERLQEIYGEEWQRIVETRYRITEPFWRYSQARFSSQISGNLEHEPRLVGYGEDNVEGWSDAVADIVGGRITAVNTRNPHQMLFIRTAHGLPLFAMPEVTGRMQRAYDLLKRAWEKRHAAGNPIPVHISEEWQLRDIDPLTGPPAADAQAASGSTVAPDESGDHQGGGAANGTSSGDKVVSVGSD